MVGAGRSDLICLAGERCSVVCDLPCVPTVRGFSDVLVWTMGYRDDRHFTAFISRSLISRGSFHCYIRDRAVQHKLLDTVRLSTISPSIARSSLLPHKLFPFALSSFHVVLSSLATPGPWYTLP